MCTGAVCRRDSNCYTDCCDAYDTCSYSYWCDSDNGSDLTWLWWTLGCIFLLLIVI